MLQASVSVLRCWRVVGAIVLAIFGLKAVLISDMFSCFSWFLFLCLIVWCGFTLLLFCFYYMFLFSSSMFDLLGRGPEEDPSGDNQILHALL